MTTTGFHDPATLFRWFSRTVFTLLAINVALFLLHQTALEAIDSLAWIALLLLFQQETSGADARRERWLHAGRNGAYLLVVACAVSYTLPAHSATYGWLDSLNAWTWIAIVLLLEFEVRRPEAATRAPLLQYLAKAGLYGALLVYALVWGLQESWLDFYDALLWILCFFTIELRILAPEQLAPAGHGDAATTSRSPPA